MLFRSKFPYPILLFALFFFFISISTAHACIYTVVYLNAFMRWAVGFTFLFFILASAEDTMFSRWTSLLLVGGIVPLGYLLSQYEDIEAMYTRTPLEVLGYLLIFVVLVIIRFYYKFYKQDRRAKFFTGSVLVVLLTMYVSNSVLVLNCPTCCQSRLRNLGTALEIYSVDNNGLYPSELQEIDEAYFPGKQAITICKVDGYTFIFPFIWMDLKSHGKYRPVPYEYSVSADRKHYTIICHNRTHERVTDEGYPRYTSGQGLVSRKETP